jgi:hypothetical protein
MRIINRIINNHFHKIVENKSNAGIKRKIHCLIYYGLKSIILEKGKSLFLTKSDLLEKHHPVT